MRRKSLFVVLCVAALLLPSTAVAQRRRPGAGKGAARAAARAAPVTVTLVRWPYT